MPIASAPGPRLPKRTTPPKTQRRKVGQSCRIRTVKYTKAKPDADGALPPVDIAIHIGIDRRHGLIRTWAVSDAAAHDGARLGALLDGANTASDVWADTAYRSKKNEAELGKRGFVSRIHVKKPKGKPMPAATRMANARKSRVRSAVEHVFAHEKGTHPVKTAVGLLERNAFDYAATEAAS
jgi:IS5 family transposase